jgi:ATP/ADP translocase
VRIAGIILCGFAGLAFAAMSSILAVLGWTTTLVGPALVLLLGIFMVANALVARSRKDAVEPVPAAAPAAPVAEEPAAPAEAPKSKKK